MKKKYNSPKSTVYGFSLRDGILQSASQVGDGTTTPGGDDFDDGGIGGSGSGSYGDDDLSRQDGGGNSIWDNVW
ncbi:MAG: hypothetical protein IJ606_03440 [Bacteroidaceae bacterium]|nr:hypothetical protein [Bacteroidaceae bacterium]